MSKWKVRLKGRAPVGPLDTELVVRGIQAGRVPIDAEVCAAGDDTWLPLVAVEQFHDATGLDDAHTRLIARSPASHPAAHRKDLEPSDPGEDGATQVMAMPPDLALDGEPRSAPTPAGALGHQAFMASRALAPAAARDARVPETPRVQARIGSAPDLEVAAASARSSELARKLGPLADAGDDDPTLVPGVPRHRPPTPSGSTGAAPPSPALRDGPTFRPSGPEPLASLPTGDLMDATDDADDVRVMLSPVRPGPLEPSPGGPRPIAAHARFRPDVPDEQTAPALRVIREQRRARLAWAAVITLSIFVLTLLGLLVSRL